MKKKSLSIIISIFCCGAFAQDDVKSEELSTVDVVIDKDNLYGRTEGYSATRSVAADRVNRAINETAQSISVVTRQQIEDQQPSSISDALSYSSGAVTDLVGAARRYDYIALRGFTDNATDNTMIDGLKLLSDSNTYSSMQYDPYFIERIDMIKGAVSSDFGRAVPGGIVSATTKTPLHDEPFHEISFSIGTNNHRQIGFDSTSTLNETGTVAYRMTGLAKASDSMQNGHESKRYALAPSISWDITSGTNLLLQGYFQNDPEGGYHSGLPALGTHTDNNGFKFPTSFSESEPSDLFERKQKILGYQFSHKFNNDVTLQSKFRYANTNVKNKQTYHLGWVPSTTLLARSALNGEDKQKSFVFDNNIQAEFSTGMVTHIVVGGVDYQKRNTDSDTGYNFSTVSPIDVTNPVYDNNSYTYTDYKSSDTYKLRQAGVYLNDNLEIDNWHFKLGARYDRVSSSNTNRLSHTTSKWSGSKVSGRISALYAFDNGVSPYVSYSTGFNPNTYSDKANNLLKPTTSSQLELGLKYQPVGTNNLYSIALYDIEQKNTANRVITGNYYTPSGTRSSKGIELEAKTYITDNWFVQGAFSANRPKISENTGPEAVLNGNTPSQAPKWNASLWTNYRINEAFDASLGVRYIGKQWADSTNTLELPSYKVVDLGVRWRLGASFPVLKGTELGISVKNVFDSKHITGCYNDVNYCYYGEERNVKATLNYQF